MLEGPDGGSKEVCESLYWLQEEGELKGRREQEECD